MRRRRASVVAARIGGYAHRTLRVRVESIAAEPPVDPRALTCRVPAPRYGQTARGTERWRGGRPTRGAALTVRRARLQADRWLALLPYGALLLVCPACGAVVHIEPGQFHRALGTGHWFQGGLAVIGQQQRAFLNAKVLDNPCPTHLDKICWCGPVQLADQAAQHR